MMLRWFGRMLILLVAAGAIWGLFLIKAGGVFLELAARAPGRCDIVIAGGVSGVEDITIDPETGVAWLSGYDRRALMAGRAVRGAIWAYDLSSAVPVPVDATASALPGGFLPHGISLYRSPDGRRTLFAINHAGGKQSVEIFDVQGAALVHRRTVRGAALVSPNDLVGVGHDAFYATNDHKWTSPLLRAVEDLGRLRLTDVQYFNGTSFAMAVRSLGGANGINVSADGRALYVSAATEKRVHVLDRDPQTGQLAWRTSVLVPGFADNIEILPDGSLLLGLHTKIFQFLAHVRSAAALSPSHVMRLTPDGNGGFVPHTVLYNDGLALSAASVGAARGKRMLVGSIFENRILDCAWNDAP